MIKNEKLSLYSSSLYISKHLSELDERDKGECEGGSFARYVKKPKTDEEKNSPLAGKRNFAGIFD